MAFYIVTGKLGSGKSMAVVDRIRDYLRRGCRVATNLDLNVEHLLPPGRKFDITRLPDKPTSRDFEFLGQGYDGDYDESKFGIIVLDECASWLNTRSWSADKDRQHLINWLLHSRKKYWDVYLLIQDVDALDKQVRDMFCEHLVVCSRLDRTPIPIFKFIPALLITLVIFAFTFGVKTVLIWGSPVLAFFGWFASGIGLPRIHIAKVFYGDNIAAPMVDRWIYRGGDLMPAYDTRQRFYDPDSPPAVGLSQLVPQPRPPRKPFPMRKFAFITAAVLIAGITALSLAPLWLPPVQAQAAALSSDPDAAPAAQVHEPLRIALSWMLSDGRMSYVFHRGPAPLSDTEAASLAVQAVSSCYAVVTHPGGRREPVSCAYAPVPAPQAPGASGVSGVRSAPGAPESAQPSGNPLGNAILNAAG